MIDIEQIKAETGANIVIIVDNYGTIINSTETEYVKNFALMTESAFSMCDALLKDMTDTNLDQLIAKSKENLFIANRLDENSIILVTTDNLSKFGLLLKYMNSIENK
ncbi:hypothetical protein [Psychroserpens sp. NJDZ02]|uniref:hypothetical protein n=1 Tax=Psychroserpens sp. NJDZ02 TaxID=2570561 RepID=UPI0010A8F6DC|nr:hypothetical protein [Psychroserpens sp. NJDZ02]QCE41635.1 hypothetical protein E9099_09470 [Psychroserpens sp. NJDZ02]